MVAEVCLGKVGAVAARERGVRAPLMEAGMTKADIREAALLLGVPNWDKPAMACLSSRVPYGEAITPEKLRQIDRAEQALRYLGYRQATLMAVYAGFVTAVLVGLYGIVADELLALCLAVFIYAACNHQWIVLETGGEEGLFGYDFSQGYTSLERDQPAAPPKPRLSWWQRWQQRRAAKRLAREQEAREADERRMDQLLEKISTQGMDKLTDEERRFMKQFSERYKKH